MYFQKDYILRMIEMMGDMMRRIFELLDDLQRMRMLNDAAKKYCGINLDAANKLSAESLVDMLSPQPRLMMAEILYIQACAIKPDEERKPIAYYKIVKLLLSLKEESLLCEIRYERLLECIEACDVQLSSQDYLDAAMFMLEAEQFAYSEDIIYRGIDAVSIAPEEYKAYLQQAIELMSGCLQITDERLIIGGLPRDEVTESVDTLQRKLSAAKQEPSIL